MTTASQFELVKRAVAKANLLCIDLPLFSLDIDDVDDAEELDDSEFAETQETIEDFETASKSYREVAARRRFDIDGTPCLVLGRVQLARGRQRQDIVVVDLGTHRVAVMA